ncbi:SIMPL domain-containing protein [Parolsenella catena]|uniref:SIMPL domain-containing protein n=1 Tax=Parolsenella catena TaxID=2003188 RepID=UPI002941CFBA|nr:SIMPL domain-containing protein [Parolsenella catena]
MANTNSGYISVGASVEDKVMPDRVTFKICFEGSKRTKDECLAGYNADRARIAKALAPFGLDKELTCKRYSCYSRTTRKKNTILGYSYYAHGSIETDLASVDHAAVWQTLNTCGVRADMDVSFGIKDRRASQAAARRKTVLAPPVPPKQDWVYKALSVEGLKFVDKRSEAGCLWAIGGGELDAKMQELAKRGAEFEFSLRGGKATGGQPARWLKGYPDEETVQEEAPAVSQGKLDAIKPGDIVHHRAFGDGEVVRVDRERGPSRPSLALARGASPSTGCSCSPMRLSKGC